MFPAIQPIPLLVPADYQDGGSDFDSINMGQLHKADILITFGAITGNDATIKLFSGATAGAKTTELPFRYRLSAADAGNADADTYGDRAWVETGGDGLKLANAAAYDTRTVWIEFFSDQMTDGHKWLTVSMADGSASVLLVSAIAIGWPRMGGDNAPTAL